MNNKDKLKVGRPKLADTDLKKKSLIISGIMLLVSIALLAGGLISLNILPKFNKLKGTVTCTSIPEHLKPGYVDPVTGETNQYGFTDINFYSSVISYYGNDYGGNQDSSYCNTITKEQLASIRSIGYYSNPITGISNTDGIEFLSSLDRIVLENNNLDSIDLSNNVNLEIIELNNNNLNSINLGSNVIVERLLLSNNNLSGELDISNMPNIARLEIDNNNYTSLKLGNQKFAALNISNNEIEGTLNIISEDENWESCDGIACSSTSYDMEILLSNNKLSSVSLTNFAGGTFDASHNNLQDVSINNSMIRDVKLNNNNLNNININNIVINTLNISNNNLSNLDLSQLNHLDELNANNNKLNNITNLSNIHDLQELYLSNNNISEIDLSSNDSLQTINLNNNNLTGTLDLSNLINIQNDSLFLQHNKLENVKFPNNISAIFLYDNKISTIDLSNLENIEAIMLQDNPMENTKYMLKGENIKYISPIKLNENINVITKVADEEIIEYKDEKITALKEGITNIRLSSENIENVNSEIEDFVVECQDGLNNSNPNCSEEKFNELIEKYNINPETGEGVSLPYFFSQEIVVYDIGSDKYNIDKDKKEIDVKGKDIKIEDIDLGLEGLSGVVEGDNYIIKDGDTIVDTYKLVNMKKEEVKPSDTNNKETTTNNNVVSTTKKKVKIHRKIFNTTKEEIKTTTNIIINKIIKKNKGTTTTKVVEKKDNKCRWIWWPILLIILIIGYIIYKNKKDRN